MIWFNNVRSNRACKAKHFGGELNVTGFSHFVEKYFLTNSIIRNFSREPEGSDYLDTAVHFFRNFEF